MNRDIKLDVDNKQISEGVNHSSWESLNKLKRLSSKKFKKQNSDGQALSTSMPNIHLNNYKRNKLKFHTRSVSQTEEVILKSTNSISGGFGSNNTHNTNNDVEYLNLNFNHLTGDEIKSQLEVIKISYEKKIGEIDNIYKEMNLKDEKINQITLVIGNMLKKEEEIQKTNNSANNQMKEISELKIEIINSKRRHNKKLADIEKLSEEETKFNIEKIRDEYSMRIREFSDGHEKNIKFFQEEILTMKKKLDKLDNKEHYINKSVHNEILLDIKKKNQNELDSYEKEIEKIENLIKENFCHIASKNKMTTEKNEDSNFLNFADFQRELQNGNENNDLICIISQLDTPVCTTNTLVHNTLQNNFKKNNINNNFYNNYNSNKHNLDFSEDTYILEEDESIYEEVRINKINNLNIEKAQYFENQK